MALLVELVGVLGAPIAVIHIGEVIQPIGHFHVDGVVRVQISGQFVDGDLEGFNVLLPH